MNKSKLYIAVGMIIALTLLLSACGGKSTAVEAQPTAAPIVSTQVLAEGHLVPARDAALSFATQGTVSKILVSEGDAVKAGQVLVQLADQQQAQSALASAQLALLNAQQAYDDFMRAADLSLSQAWQNLMDAQIARAQAERNWEALNLDQIQSDIDDATATLKDREKILTDAQDVFNRYANLDKNNVSRTNAKNALDTAQNNYNDAVRLLEQTQRQKDSVRAALDAAIATETEAQRVYDAILNNGVDPDQQALLQANLDQAQAQVDAAQNALDQYTLTAPFDGIVTLIQAKEGQMAAPGMLAVQMADFSAWYVETSDLSELEVVNVSVGQQVQIVPDALPELQLTGIVEQIGQSFTVQAGDILYKVKIRLQDSDPALRWGMTVENTFQP